MINLGLMYPLLYFGTVSYWKELLTHERLEFNLSTSVPKKSYLNRCVIATANGLHTLSIPIHGGRGTRQSFRDIEISYAENWMAKHKMALQSAYSKSPFYEFYIDRYEEAISNKYQYLHELNLTLFSVTTSILKASIGVKLVESKLKPDFDSFSPALFNEVPEYPQVFRSKYRFQSDLCILDLIFNLGNQSAAYFKIPST
jgi:hypothetical protein